MRSLAPLAVLCLLAACAGELDAGTDPNSRNDDIGASGGGASGQGGGDTAGGAGASGASDQAGQGGTTEPGGSAGQGGTAGSGGTGAAGDAAGSGGATGGAGGGAGAGGAPENPLQGEIEVGVMHNLNVGISTPTYVNSASALFADNTGLMIAPDGCTTLEQTISCSLVVCEDPPAGTGGAGGASFEAIKSAGDITITGAGYSPILLSFKNGYYTKKQPGSELPDAKPVLKGGESIEVTAAGADVPAFSIATQVPASPSLGGLTSGKNEVDTTKNLVMPLSGGEQGGIVVFAASVKQGTSTTFLSCVALATDTSLTLPAEGLQALAAVAPEADYQRWAFSRATTKVGAWDITLALRTTLQDQDGNELSTLGALQFK